MSWTHPDRIHSIRGPNIAAFDIYSAALMVQWFGSVLTTTRSLRGYFNLCSNKSDAHNLYIKMSGIPPLPRRTISSSLQGRSAAVLVPSFPQAELATSCSSGDPFLRRMPYCNSWHCGDSFSPKLCQLGTIRAVNIHKSIHVANA